VKKTSAFLIFILTVTLIHSQDKPYWRQKTKTGTQLYKIIFLDKDNGLAESRLGVSLRTTDGGTHWEVIEYPVEVSEIVDWIWTASIHCAVMSSSDGGKTWMPFMGIEQEHFCSTYFNDKESGWKKGDNFLREVVGKIKTHLARDDINSILDRSFQCSEYFTAIDSGWALGWCLKEFDIK
jgi:hypothetical protein